MSTSIILLVALQALWLGNSYERAAEDLQNESTRMLHETVINLRDSLLLRKIEVLPADGNILTRRTDSTFMFMSESPTRHRSEGQVQVFVSSTTSADSARQLLRSVASKVHEGAMRSNSRYTIRLDNDSLSLDSIRIGLRRQLQQAGLPQVVELNRKGSMPLFTPGHAPVRMRRMEGDDREKVPTSFFASTIRTNWVRADPFFRYSATLGSVRPMLLQRIAPQLLFSGFLTLLTMGSFVVMYRSIRSQQRLMELKNDFISNITHELKTPIATVSVALEALKNFKGIENPKLTAEYLDIAQLELNRLSILTEKVLTTSLFDENGETLELEPVNLEETVGKVVNSLKLVTEKAHATLSFEKTGDHFVVTGSGIHLTNVIYNLLDNALKYSLEKPEVSVLLREEANQVVLAVSDKGIGIPEEFQSKIFDRFFRMPTGDVHNIKGYGLGLSYVQQVVNKHGGTISVTSTPGQGSIFTIVLPKQPA